LDLNKFVALSLLAYVRGPIMKNLFLLMLLASCSTLPQLYQAAEDIADDTAIKVEVSRETLQKDTDVEININVKNKDEPKTGSPHTQSK
jgi:hypothetical protein